MKSVSASLFVILGLSQLLSANTQSPCPDIFEYKNDNNGAYGEITLKPNGRKSILTIRTNFTITARLLSDYVGSIQPYGQAQAIQEYNRGKTIQYRVNFPVSSPLPKLTALYVNDNLVCYDDPDTINDYDFVTTTTLQHTLFIETGPKVVYRPANRRPVTQPAVINYVNRDDAYIYNTDITPYTPVVTRPRPQNKPRPAPQVNREPENPPQNTPSRFTEDDDISNIQCGKAKKEVPLIWHGQSYTRGEWPWLVAIYHNKDRTLKFFCSGTLVSDRHVISAAHCMYEKDTTDIIVKVGVFSLDDWGADILVRKLESAVSHEKYSKENYTNDISLLTLEQSVQFSSNVKPVCLWSGNPDLARIVGQTGVVTGWGDSEMGKGGHGEPRMIRLPIVSTTNCRASKSHFHKITSDTTLCAGNRDGSGPCSGDSGGGLFVLDDARWKLRGIVSVALSATSAEKRCNLDEFVVFTDVAQYITWIKRHMQF